MSCRCYGAAADKNSYKHAKQPTGLDNKLSERNMNLMNLDSVVMITTISESKYVSAFPIYWCDFLPTSNPPEIYTPGLGRVPDLRVRVQVRVLVICVSTSTSPSTWLLHEYESESENWLMSTSTSTSTGLWSTFYIACIGSRFLLFGLWQECPQIPTNLGQSSNCPLSM